MKRSIISLLVVALCAGTATAALAQNVTAGDKAGATSQTPATDQKEMTNPTKNEQAMTPRKGKHDKGAAAFKKADKDNDGTLDQEEAKAMPHVAKHFEAIDVDKDGTVSLEEVHTFMKGRHEAIKN
jgi:Ca2+-binding EF-hand superfamily protein